MKKLMLVLIVLMLVCGTSAALAATGKPGDTVDVSFSVTSNSAAMSATVTFSYDSSALEFVSASGSNGWIAPQGGSGRFSVMNSDSIIPTGAIGTITFKIKSDAQAGTYSVSASVSRAIDTNYESVSLGVSGGSVTVVRDDPTPAPTEKPTAVPTAVPTEKPTAVPTAIPTEKPTAVPTAIPTEKPTVVPTAIPTEKPTAVPTAVPTEKPTAVPTAAPTLSPTPTPTVKPDTTPDTWRYYQTLSSLGIRFRDVAPALTDTWHMFTPLDLSEDGKTVIPLLAGGISEVGNITVTVADGTAVIDYALNKRVQLVNIGCTLFPDLNSVDTVDVKKQDQYSFRQSISIAEDLNGDTSMLLYVFGQVNYDFEQQPIYRLSGQKYEAIVEQLKLLMD